MSGSSQRLHTSLSQMKQSACRGNGLDVEIAAIGSRWTCEFVPSRQSADDRHRPDKYQGHEEAWRRFHVR